jgi:hypothetical protein
MEEAHGITHDGGSKPDAVQRANSEASGARKQTNSDTRRHLSHPSQSRLSKRSGGLEAQTVQLKSGRAASGRTTEHEDSQGVSSLWRTRTADPLLTTKLRGTSGDNADERRSSGAAVLEFVSDALG